MDVRKPCGFKKPVSQKDGGLSLAIQLFNWKCLSTRPFNQAAREGVSQDLSTPVGSYYHEVGTLKSNTASIEATISAVILIEPSIASIMSTIVFLTMDKIFWNHSISYLKKMLSGTVSYLPVTGSTSPFGPLSTFNLSMTSSIMKSGGSFGRSSFSIFSLT